MTTIYFVRHAESKYDFLDESARPLTPKGMSDRKSVTKFLCDKGVHKVFSSPYRRAIDTVSDFAEKCGMEIHYVDDFRERKVGGEPAGDFLAFTRLQWEDFSYKLPGGESLSEVQSRNIAALERLLLENEGKTLVIGTHGTALSTIINYYNNMFVFENFYRIIQVMPWIVRFSFNRIDCIEIQDNDNYVNYRTEAYK